MALTSDDTAATASNGSASPDPEIPTVDGDSKPVAAAAAGGEKRWPGWPGDTVYRLIVPVLKVGSIIGRKGELIKKLCEDTRARVRILDGALSSNDRIVLVSGKEELDAAISPAMDAVLRIFKRINGLSESGVDATTPALCTVRLLVTSYQSINLIGKHGATIKPIQDGTGANVSVLTGDELPYVTEDERVVDIQGEPLKVLRALEAVTGHLRKFLVDHSVLPLYEKSLNTPATRDRPVDPWAEKAQPMINTAHETQLSDYQRSGLSLYGQDPALAGLRSSGLGRTPGAFVTQITQQMQIPLAYAEDIIGAGGRNIANIRRSSGALITVMETKGVPDEITVEIKGTNTQVQTASQLIQDSSNVRKEPLVSSYLGYDTGLRSSYSHLTSTSYPSSLSSHSLGGYGGAYDGYSSYRI